MSIQVPALVRQNAVMERQNSLGFNYYPEIRAVTISSRGLVKVIYSNNRVEGSNTHAMDLFLHASDYKALGTYKLGQHCLLFFFCHIDDYNKIIRVHKNPDRPQMCPELLNGEFNAIQNELRGLPFTIDISDP